MAQAQQQPERYTGETLPAWSLPAAAAAQSPSLSKEVKEFVSVDAPAVVLRHVRVIDGTGAAAKEDQSLVIAGGRIEKIIGRSMLPVWRPPYGSYDGRDLQIAGELGLHGAADLVVER